MAFIITSPPPLKACLISFAVYHSSPKVLCLLLWHRLISVLCLRFVVMLYNYYFWPCLMVCGILVPWPGTEYPPTTVEAWRPHVLELHVHEVLEEANPWRQKGGWWLLAGGQGWAAGEEGLFLAWCQWYKAGQHRQLCDSVNMVETTAPRTSPEWANRMVMWLCLNTVVMKI